MINAELDSIMSELRNISTVEENSGFWRKDEIAEVMLDVDGERINQWVGHCTEDVRHCLAPRPHLSALSLVVWRRQTGQT